MVAVGMASARSTQAIQRVLSRAEDVTLRNQVCAQSAGARGFAKHSAHSQRTARQGSLCRRAESGRFATNVRPWWARQVDVSSSFALADANSSSVKAPIVLSFASRSSSSSHAGDVVALARGTSGSPPEMPESAPGATAGLPSGVPAIARCSRSLMLFKLASPLVAVSADLKERSVDPARTFSFFSMTPEMPADWMELSGKLVTSPAPPEHLLPLKDEALSGHAEPALPKPATAFERGGDLHHDLLHRVLPIGSIHA